MVLVLLGGVLATLMLSLIVARGELGAIAMAMGAEAGGAKTASSNASWGARALLEFASICETERKTAAMKRWQG